MKTYLLDGLWGRPLRLQLLKRRLEQAGIGEVEICRYDASGRSCLLDEGRKFVDHLASTEGPVNLVGYSMGGLVIRSTCLAAPDLPVRSAAFLNTPHAGSLAARLLPGAGITQMRPSSEFLRQLDDADWQVPTFVAWTPGDLMVLPASSARWRRATHTHRLGVPAHVWPLYSRTLHRNLATFLTSPSQRQTLNHRLSK
ncbi:MAG: alpha/beta fold hydrolase [Chthoniobacterales bacterium]